MDYSICIAILVAVATIVNWSMSNTRLLWIGLAANVLLSAMAILFCTLWVKQIRDFKNLNNAKFSVLNDMAPKIEFDLSTPGHVTSYCPFEKEWQKLSSLNALQEVGPLNLRALKSSNIEYFIPKAFAGLFLTILLALVGIMINEWPPSTLRLSAAIAPTKPAREAQP